MAEPSSAAMRPAPPAAARGRLPFRRAEGVSAMGVDRTKESLDDMSDIIKRQALKGWEEAQMSTLRRRTILGGALGTLAAPHVNAQGGKPYAGTTINGSCFQTPYYTYLKDYFPQFEEKTGIKVNFNMQAFPVYNQRTDLELSTKGSAMDVCNVTFIYSGRWIGSGWLTNLDPFTKDKKYTPAEWAPEDFIGGPQSAMQNAKGETFGYAWLAGAMIMGAARYDPSARGVRKSAH